MRRKRKISSYYDTGMPCDGLMGVLLRHNIKGRGNVCFPGSENLLPPERGTRMGRWLASGIGKVWSSEFCQSISPANLSPLARWGLEQLYSWAVPVYIRGCTWDCLVQPQSATLVFSLSSFLLCCQLLPATTREYTKESRSWDAFETDHFLAPSSFARWKIKMSFWDVTTIITTLQALLRPLSEMVKFLGCPPPLITNRC